MLLRETFAMSSLFRGPERFRDSVFSVHKHIWFVMVLWKPSAGCYLLEETGKNATCTCAAGTWAHCLSANEGEQQCNACGQWMMINANRKLKSLGSKGILLVTFSPHIWSSWGLSHLNCMWNLFKYFYNFNLTLTSNLTPEMGGFFPVLFFFGQIYVKYCLGLSWVVPSEMKPRLLKEKNIICGRWHESIEGTVKTLECHYKNMMFFLCFRAKRKQTRETKEPVSASPAPVFILSSSLTPRFPDSLLYIVCVSGMKWLSSHFDLIPFEDQTHTGTLQQLFILIWEDALFKEMH